MVTGIKQKTIHWLKNRNNQIFLGILLLAFIIRLYYFFVTKGQNLWWDEAEYMNMARAWAFNLDYSYWVPVRPILLSFLTSFLLQIANTEFLPRLMIFGLSMLSVIGIYYLGKEMFNEKLGLISSFLMAIFYLGIFHTYRLLVDLPSLTFYIFAALFFYKYFKTRSHKMLYIGAVIVALGTLFRITTAVFLIAIMIYVLVTEKLPLFKRKEYYISAILFWLILTPYLIWGYSMFGGFVISQAGAWNSPADNKISNAIGNFTDYMSMFPWMFSWVLLIIFILGVLSMYKLFIGFDLLLKNKGDPNLKKYFYLVLLFLIPILLTSYSLGNMPEDRYIITAVPSVFIISSLFLVKIPKFNLFDKNKTLAILVILALLLFIGYTQVSQADKIVRSKTGFRLMQESGEWIKENSDPSDIIIATSHPMTMYYSERNTLTIPQTEEDFEKLKSSTPELKYFVLSNPQVQKSPDWSYVYPSKKNLSLVKVYFADEAQQFPLMGIYSLE